MPGQKLISLSRNISESKKLPPSSLLLSTHEEPEMVEAMVISCAVEASEGASSMSTPQMSRVHHLDKYDPNIAVSGYKLERIKSCKLLGVHINEHLKWDDHIKHTVSGCYATLSILRKLKYLAKYELRKQLAETLILSKLDYADLVFYPLPQFLLCHLQRVQFAAASFVLGHCVKNFRDVLKIGWLPINEKRSEPPEIMF